MFARLFRRRRPAAPPPPPLMLPGIAVEAVKPPAPAPDMVDVMQAGIRQCYRDGVTDPDRLRLAQLEAREALKKARERSLAEKRPVELAIGEESFLVRPL